MITQSSTPSRAPVQGIKLTTEPRWGTSSNVERGVTKTRYVPQTFLARRTSAMQPLFVCRDALSAEFGRLQSFSVGGILAQDWLSCAIAMAGSYLWIKFLGLLSDKDVVQRSISRKLLHITVGPFFVLSWCLFTPTSGAQYVAAAVPMANALRLIANGLGVLKDRSFVTSMSREGTSAELLAGPLLYVLTLTMVTCVFWRGSIVSYLAVGIMSGGDGMADIIGRRFGKHKLPYNREKSIEGSLAFVVFGSLMTLGLTGFFSWAGSLHLEGSALLVSLQVLLITAICALLESLPLTAKVDDNFIVPFAAIALGLLM